MKMKTLGLAASLMAGVMLAAPAFATVTIDATINKNKDITVTENITIYKDVTLNAEVDIDVTHAAEAVALANIVTKNNNVLSTNQGSDEGLTKTATIQFSVGDNGDATGALGNVGIVGVDQDVGNNTNQGNLVAFAHTDEGLELKAFTNAEASVDQKNKDNNVIWGVQGGAAISLTALIDSSVSFNIGIVGVNQNAGNNNSQINAVALAVAFGGNNPVDDKLAVALAEADLGQSNTGNVVKEFNVNGNATISDSVNHNLGLIGVNQATGNNSNQANVLSVAVAMKPPLAI